MDPKIQRVAVLTGVTEFAIKYYPPGKMKNALQSAAIGEPITSWPPPNADEISTAILFLLFHTEYTRAL